MKTCNLKTDHLKGRTPKTYAPTFIPVAIIADIKTIFVHPHDEQNKKHNSKTGFRQGDKLPQLKTQLSKPKLLSLLIFRWTFWDLAQYLLIEHSILLLDLNHCLLRESIYLILIFLIQHRYSVEQNKPYIDQSQEVAAAPQDGQDPQAKYHTEEFLQVFSRSYVS